MFWVKVFFLSFYFYKGKKAFFIVRFNSTILPHLVGKLLRHGSSLCFPKSLYVQLKLRACYRPRLCGIHLGVDSSR